MKAMKDYYQIRGLNPKKTPLQPLAQYCAAAEIAEEEIKRHGEEARDCLGAFLVFRLSEEEAKASGPAFPESLTVSDLIYVGAAGPDGTLLSEPMHEEAEDIFEEDLESCNDDEALAAMEFYDSPDATE